MQNLIRESIEQTRAVIGQALEDKELLTAIEKAGMLCVEALKQKKKVLIAGNGGSAADSQHIAAELVSRLNYDRPGLSSIALTTDTSALTAIGNDYGFERVFARQIEALGQEGDVFIALSTSGNSPNILAALEAAKNQKIKTIGMTGKTGGKMAALCDIALKMPSTHTPNIQECHIMFAHIICQIIEDSIFGKEYGNKKASA
jgi:D-sedoheptulose 7-phosphate isomerase